jgi:hypothetical protein
MLNFPSLYAPAPPNPLVMEHAGRQPAKSFLPAAGGQSLIFSSKIGQRLR